MKKIASILIPIAIGAAIVLDVSNKSFAQAATNITGSAKVISPVTILYLIGIAIANVMVVIEIVKLKRVFRNY